MYIIEILRKQAAYDPLLREHIGLIGQTLLTVAQAPSSVLIDPISDPMVESSPPIVAPIPPPIAPPIAPPRPNVPPPTEDELLRFQRVMMGAEPHPDERPAISVRSTLPSSPPPDLQLIARRCKIKASILEWFLQPANARGGSVAPAELIQRAKNTTDCQLWMLRPDGTLAVERQYLPMLVATLNTAEMMATMLERLEIYPLARPALQKSFDLTAEVQSALRAALYLAKVPTPDLDQFALFNWLTDQAKESQLFIQRFMRKNDRADPKLWLDRLERVQLWKAELDPQIEQQRRRHKLMGGLRYRLRAELPTTNDPESLVQLWHRIVEALDQLVESGMPPTHRTLRALLLPYHQQIPAAVVWTPRAQSVRDAVVAYQAQATTAAPVEPDAEVEAAEHIAEVADLLRNKVMVLIGGDRRPYIEQTLKDTFELQDLVWCATPPGKSHLDLEPYIARPDTYIIILAIRWASHNLSEIDTFCVQYQKPFVRLPAGYNPSQMAFQILKQVGDRLRQASERERIGAA